MANFIFAIGPTARLESLTRFFSPEDIEHKLLDEHFGQVFIARNAQRFRTSAGYFKGYGIDHRYRSIIFGPAASANLRDSHAEGCFVRIRERPVGTVVDGDWFGLMPRLYFCDGEHMAISDSLASLCEIRRLFGLRVQIHEEALLSRAWSNGAADQLHEELTPIEGIRYCLPSNRLSISVNDHRVKVTSEFTSPLRQIDAAQLDYVPLLRGAANRIVGVTTALAAHTDARLALSLSGGLDSRVVLAALQKTEQPDRVRLSTNVASERDAEVASLVAAHVNRPLNTPQRSGARSRVDRFALWGLFNAGVYDPLFSVNQIQEAGTSLAFGGHGAELCKGSYGWKSLKQIANHAGEAKVDYLNAVTRGISAYQIEPSTRGSAEWYNVGYRSPIHCGRFIMAGTFGMRPLLDRGLLLLSRSDANHFPQPRPAAPSIISDLLVLLDPELALIPFTKPLEDVDIAHVRRRSEHLGSLGPVEPYTTIGHPTDMSGGIPAVLLERMVERGYVGGLNGRAVREAVEAAEVRLPPSVRAAYARILELADHEFEGQVAASSPSSRAAGKLLVTLLVD